MRLSRADSRSVTQVQMPNPQDRVPSPNYMVRGQATSANLKTEGACGSYQPFSCGKMLVQQNDVASMSGSATQGIAATCGNLPTQERAPTLHPILPAPPWQDDFGVPVTKTGGTGKDGPETHRVFTRGRSWTTAPSGMPTRSQVAMRIVKLTAQNNAKRHFRKSVRARKKQSASPIKNYSSGSKQGMPEDRYSDEWEDEDRYPPKGQSPTKTHASLAVPTAVFVPGTYFAPQAYGLKIPDSAGSASQDEARRGVPLSCPPLSLSSYWGEGIAWRRLGADEGPTISAAANSRDLHAAARREYLCGRTKGH